MTVKSFTLTDVDADTWVDETTIGPSEVGGKSQGYSVHKRTLRGGLRDGVDLIEVDNGAWRFAVLPTRGMGLWRAWHGELELGWKSPVKGPVHPQFVPTSEPGGLGWLSGFDELLCRCGLESNGAPEFGDEGRLKYALHGRIANLPAHRVHVSVDGDSGEIAVTGVVDEARLYHNKMRLTSTVATRVGETRLWIVDEVANLSAETGDVELLYHINFGAPLLDPGAKLVAPVKTIVPRNARAAEGIKSWDTYGNEEPNFAEQVYFFELAAADDGRTQALLRSAHGNRGIRLAFNRKQLPCFTLWKSTQAAQDGYVTGIEPGLNFPNPKSFEQAEGRVVRLKPGGKLKFEIEIEFLPDTASVANVEHAIGELQAGQAPKVYDRPMPHWTTS